MSGNLEKPGSLSGADPANSLVRLGNQLERLERALDQLIETHQALKQDLVAKQDRGKRKEMPSPNTKYYEFLVYLNDTYGSSEFTSEDIPRQSKHILSILNIEYSSLEVNSKRGRTNVYNINPLIRKKLGKKP
jgi:hypothetical protein